MIIPFLYLLTLISTSLYKNSTGTYDCYYRCQSCIGITSLNCTSCYTNYIISNNSCKTCTSNCLSCITQTSKCETCANKFYLSQSTWTCNPCPIGAQLCTFSAIQQCISGYYLINSICLYCINNCQICIDSYTCQICNKGYYLTNQLTCKPCLISYCSNCDSNGICTLCENNRYGVNCNQICQSYCQICDNLICYQCESGYYLTQKGSCEALSVVCLSGSAPYRCQRCIDDIGFLDGQICLPYTSVHQNNQQIYIKPLNQGELFDGKLINCNDFWVVVKQQSISVNITIKPSYKILIKILLATSIPINTTQRITISSPQLQQIYQFSTTSNYTYQCSNNSYLLTKIQYNFTPIFLTSNLQQSLNLQLKTQQNIILGILQILIQQYLCLIPQCGICLSSYSCINCLSPYLLENNNCILQCSQGYYYTQQLSTCTINCPQLFFPNLADYTCSLCISPCKTCKSSTECISCIQNWFILLNICYQNCPFGYYQNNLTNTCTICQCPCNNCNSNSMDCISCNIGFLLSNNTCSMICPIGYYNNFTTISCHLCSDQCLTCQFQSNHCTNCIQSLFLNPNNTCLSSCDLTYAQNIINNKCQKCQYPCYTCNNISINCTKCYIGYLQENRCVSTCSIGRYNNFQQKICSLCINNCKSCISKLQCLSCNDGYYYTQSMQICTINCPNNYYPSNTSLCQKCNSPCQNCINNTYCLNCQGYLFVYYLGKCLLSCPIGTYILLNQITNQITCQLCGRNCEICISIQECIMCNNNSSLFSGGCLDICPEKTYEYDNICKNCIFPCYNCSSSDICLSCIKGYYYYNISNTCLKICPNGYFSSSSQQICLPCSITCSLCLDQTINCIKCSNGYYKNNNGSCMKTCNIGQYPYPLQNLCKKCINPCMQCLTGGLCTRCNNTSIYPYLFRYNCLSLCPNGYFVNSNSICEICSIQCLKCSKISNNCTECDGNHFFLSNITNHCLSTCPDQYYPNSVAYCIPCLFPCKLCINQFYCLSCISDIYSLFNGNCLSICPYGYYSIQQNNINICKLCNDNCLQCMGNSINCTQCGSEYFLSLRVSSNNSYICIQICDQYYYADVINQICSKCLSPCLLCHTQTKCITCLEGFYLQYDLCLKGCLNGYYIQQNICIACIAPCATCISNYSCLSCISNYYLQPNQTKCINQCPSQTYPYETSNGDLQCLSCSNTCYQCYDSNSCRSCKNNSLLPYLQGTTCQATCTNGYYSINTSYICQWCGWGCLFCNNSGVCIQCSNSYLFQGICQISCPISYYESISFSCQKCISPCYTCYDSSNCQICIHGYFLYLTHCLTSCPLNQWAILTLGICNQTCNLPLYKIVQNKTCVGNCLNYYDYNGNCVDRCQIQTMANSSLGCQSCLTADCLKMLYFTLKIYQNDGILYIVIAFNLPIDSYNNFTVENIGLNLNPSVNIDPSHLSLSALRNLMQIQSNTLEIIQKQPYFITLKVNLHSYGDIFSGILQLSILNLKILTTNNYPIQIPTMNTTLIQYQSNNGGYYSQYYGIFISIILIIVFLLNYIIGNDRSMIIIIDGVQNIHGLYYLAIWNHPIIQNYMIGLKYTTLCFNVSNFEEYAYLWNCTQKYIVSNGNCNYYSQLIIPIITLVFLILLGFLCKYIKFCENKHIFLWNHMNSIWWFVGMSIGISSLNQLQSNSISNFLISILLTIIFLFISLILGFKIIQNVYSNSFKQKCFFWDLKRKKAQHQLSNLHLLFLLIRRIIIIISVSIGYQNPLSSLFIITLITITILSNIFINHPFKNNGIIIGISQSGFAIILVLIQMYIVNIRRLSNYVWNGFGYGIFVMMVIYTSLLVFLAVKETIIHIRKVYGKFKYSNKEEEKKSNNEKQQKIEAELQEPNQNNQVADETQHQLVKEQSEHIFSQSEQPQKNAPKILLKIQKEAQACESIERDQQQ